MTWNSCQICRNKISMKCHMMLRKSKKKKTEWGGQECFAVFSKQRELTVLSWCYIKECYKGHKSRHHDSLPFLSPGKQNWHGGWHPPRSTPHKRMLFSWRLSPALPSAPFNRWKWLKVTKSLLLCLLYYINRVLLTPSGLQCLRPAAGLAWDCLQPSANKQGNALWKLILWMFVGRLLIYVTVWEYTP